MPWLFLILGIILLLSGVLGQVYSLKTKRGVLDPSTRIMRLALRVFLVLAGLALLAVALTRLAPLHH